MANVYNVAKAGLADGTIDWVVDTIKIALLDAATYTYNPDHDVMTTVVAAGAEIVATNYTGGHAGAGRKTIGTKSVNPDDTNDRATLVGTIPTWTALGGATNDTVGAAVIFQELASDAASIPIAYFDISPDVPTNGSDFSLSATSNILITLDD
jgi:hypothetical protein